MPPVEDAATSTYTSPPPGVPHVTRGEPKLLTRQSNPTTHQPAGTSSGMVTACEITRLVEIEGAAACRFTFTYFCCRPVPTLV